MHEAFDTTVCLPGVVVGVVDADDKTFRRPPCRAREMITRLAPAVRWPDALALLVIAPVHSSTMSMFLAAHGSLLASRSAEVETNTPPMFMPPGTSSTRRVPAAMHRVMRKEVRQHVVAGEVVDVHKLDVGAAPGRTHDVATDAAEAVDGDADGHVEVLDRVWVPRVSQMPPAWATNQ